MEETLGLSEIVAIKKGIQSTISAKVPPEQAPQVGLSKPLKSVKVIDNMEV